jgi:hypothetical protein
MIHIDHNIAAISAPYTLPSTARSITVAPNIINLIRRNDRWLISGIADNSRKD